MSKEHWLGCGFCGSSGFVPPTPSCWFVWLYPCRRGACQSRRYARAAGAGNPAVDAHSGFVGCMDDCAYCHAVLCGDDDEQGAPWRTSIGPTEELRSCYAGTTPSPACGDVREATQSDREVVAPDPGGPENRLSPIGSVGGCTSQRTARTLPATAVFARSCTDSPSKWYPASALFTKVVSESVGGERHAWRKPRWPQSSCVGSQGTLKHLPDIAFQETLLADEDFEDALPGHQLLRGCCNGRASRGSVLSSLCGPLWAELGKAVQNIHEAGQVASRIELDELSDPFRCTALHRRRALSARWYDGPRAMDRSRRSSGPHRPQGPRACRCSAGSARLA